MKIGDLEFRDNEGNEINPTKNQMAMFIDHLYNENKVFKKALELSCKFRLNFSTLVGNEYDKELKENMDYFIQQAKESLKC